MFYVILSSVSLAIFFVAGALGLWTTFQKGRFSYQPSLREYMPALIYYAVALVAFFAAYFVGLQIPDCYVH